MTPEDIEKLYQDALDRGVDSELLAETRDAAVAPCGGDMERLAREWTFRIQLDKFIAELRAADLWPSVRNQPPL
jgi:hypothetical protein